MTGSGNTTATGFLQGKFIMGTGTMGVAAGAAAGSSPSIACATSHVCDGVSGTVTLTTGTSPTTGTLATLSFPNTHSNQANCMVTHAERDRGDHQQYMDGKHDGDHGHGEYGADGLDGVHDQVLVRRVLRRPVGIGGAARAGCAFAWRATWALVVKPAVRTSSLGRTSLRFGAVAVAVSVARDGGIRAPSLTASERSTPSGRMHGEETGWQAAEVVARLRAPVWKVCLAKQGRKELEQYGRILDQRPASLGGRTAGMALAEELLVVRSRNGRPAKLKANKVQEAFEERRGQRNIVLKARQMGLTTWVAARFFLKTITQPGTLTLEVAHTQEAAEEIFRIVHRFVDWLPDGLRKGALKTARSNVRQIVFPEIDAQYRVVSAADRNAGRGLTVQNLHCSELARWPGDAAETLAGLRAAMAPERSWFWSPRHWEWEGASTRSG